MTQAAVFSVDLPLGWRRAANDVVACALAYRLRLQSLGTPTHELDGVFETQRLVYAAVGDARRVTGEDPIACCCNHALACRCRQYLIVVALTSRIAKRLGRNPDALEKESLDRLDAYLDNRS